MKFIDAAVCARVSPNGYVSIRRRFAQLYFELYLSFPALTGKPAGRRGRKASGLQDQRDQQIAGLPAAPLRRAAVFLDINLLAGSRTGIT
jgi:hypothetical protein